MKSREKRPGVEKDEKPVCGEMTFAKIWKWIEMRFGYISIEGIAEIRFKIFLSIEGTRKYEDYV